MAIIDELVTILGFDMRGETEARRYQAAIDGISRSAAGMAAALGRAAAVAGAAATAGFGLLSKSVLQTGSEFEKLHLQLEMLEGSTQKAGERMEWLRKFALNTPLDLKGATAAYIKMKNFGMDPLNGSMQAIVDTNAMMAGSQEQLEGIVLALGQAWTKQKFQAEEANQLLERGVPAWDLLSKAMGKSTKEVMELSEKGKIGRKEIQLLIDAMGQRAKGASEKFSKTFQGLTDKIVEKWTDFKKAIADSGFFQDTKNAIEAMLNSMERWEQDGTIKHAAEFVAGVFKFMSGIITATVERIMTHMAWLNKNWESAGPYVKAFAIALAGLAAYAFPIIAALAALGVVIEDVLTYFQGGESITGKLVEQFKALYDVVANWLNKTFGGLLDALKNMKWEDLGREMAKLVIKGLKALYELHVSLWDTINSGVSDMDWLEIGKKIAEGVFNGFKAIKEYIVGFWSTIWDEVYDKLPTWFKYGLDQMGLGKSSGAAAGTGGGASGGGSGGQGLRARAGRSSAGYQGRVPLKGPEAEELSRAIRKTAADIGADPEDLATLMSFESGGTFNKDKMGGKNGRYRGLIQFGPEEQKKYNIRDGMSITEYVDAAGQFFKDRGYKKGMSGAQLYATVNAGNPYKTGARDGHNGGTWGTVADKWNHQMHGHRANARKLLAGAGSAPGAEHPVGPPPSIIDQHRAKVEASRAAAGNDNRSNANVNNSVTINQTVTKATDAPKAAADATAGAVKGTLQPARMQAGPAR